MHNTEDICERTTWNKEATIEDKWQVIKQIVKEAMVKKTIKIKERKLGYKDWWDRSCTKKKREVHRNYIKWKQGKINLQQYWEERKNMKNWFLKKQNEKKEKEEEELKLIRREAEVCKFINKKRGKKTWKDNNISKEIWKDHFMTLLEGADRMATKQKRKPI